MAKNSSPEPDPEVSTPANAMSPGDQGPISGAIERLNLVSLLENVVGRLDRLEKAANPPPASAGSAWRTFALEFAKIVFGGWPAFAFLFVVLFHEPLQTAVVALADKVKETEEITSPLLSLKSKIAQLAKAEGLTALGERIPKMSAPAIKLLLEAPQQETSLVSFTNTRDFNQIEAINLPTDGFFSSAGELIDAGLVQIQGGLKGDLTRDVKLGRQDLAQLKSAIKQQYPGEERPLWREDSWHLETPLPQGISHNILLTWRLTDDGKKAVDLVLKAVAAMLEEGAQEKPAS